MLTELRPRKELLDPQFGGYKLSLDPIPVYRQNISDGVDHVTQSEDQYSFPHTKLFSLHNHLHKDNWHENTVYFIDKQWKVRRAAVNTQTGRVDTLETVWAVPKLSQRNPGHYNISLSFPSPNLAVLADGCGNLHVLNRDNTQWQVEHSTVVSSGSDSGSVLMSTYLAADSSLHCVLMSLETLSTEVESPRSNKPKPATINTVLLWMTFNKDSEGEWVLASSRRLEGPGSVDYVALEPSCTALYIGSNTNFKFTHDSANPILPPQEGKDSNAEKPLYMWEQTAEDLKVVVEVGAEVTRDEVEVIVTERELKIQCQQQTIVSGTLSNAVDTDLTTWTLQPLRLEVTLSKRESGLLWAGLVLDDTRGQQLLDPTTVEAVHARLSHLCSDMEVQEAGDASAPTFNLDQLEECDSAPEDNTYLARLDATTHTVSHQISLTGHQWLMSVWERPESVPCVCVRHDVDGCVWRLDPPTPSCLDWPYEHVGTFCALGYVAASKQQKKFVVAAPDLSYTVICEASSHVFVYCKASIVDGELRNRRTSKTVTTVAKQQLINLETSAPVLGAQATKSHLFVLTSDTLYTFNIQ